MSVQREGESHKKKEQSRNRDGYSGKTKAGKNKNIREIKQT